MTQRNIRIEGGIYPGDLPERLAAGEMPGQKKAADFGLPPSAALLEEIGSAWSDAQVFWRALKHAMERAGEQATGVTETREQWMGPLLKSLGYSDLTRASAVQVHGRSYAISHQAGAGGPPIHIAGVRQSLDTRAAAGSPRLSPHALVQEYLNVTEHLWGIATNGLQIRCLRDNSRMSRPAYVEWDLEAMLEGDHFSEFALLYRLLHRSRLPRGVDDAPACLLEQYYQGGLEEGGRVREGLRHGVEEALRILGGGFLAHPRNLILRQRARSGEISSLGFYRQLLRLVYRILFLFVAEDRALLIRPGVDRTLYDGHYSASRLRRRAEELVRSQKRHSDLWCGLLVTFRMFAEAGAGEAIGVTALDGDLFGPAALPDLDGGPGRAGQAAQLDNQSLLEAVRCLTSWTEKGVRRRVNFAGLDVEELGSVYESLLDFEPRISSPPYDPTGSLTFLLLSGSERKQTGSYYTPPSLVASLIESALVPVIQERIRGSREVGKFGGLEIGDGGRGDEGRTRGHFRAAELEMGKEKSHAEAGLSGSAGLAAGDATGGGLLPHDTGVSAGGDLWTDQPDSSGRILRPGEHRGGQRPGQPEGLRQLPPDFEGQPPRTGDLSSPGEGDRPAGPAQPAAPPGSGGFSQQTPDPPHTIPNTQTTLNPPPPHLPTSQPPILPTSQPPNLQTSQPPHLQTSAEQALLALQICDPACGSGHFLLAAARRVAGELARVRSGEEAASPEQFRAAMRDVVRHCIYGVDLNPLAVDLCKVALWLEAHVPGEPLTFLDHRIRVGNSLVGAFPVAEGAHGRPRDLPAGVPDDAFKPLEGDDRAVASRVRKLNRDGARGQTELVISGGSMQLQQALRPLNWSAYSGRMQKLGEMPDGSVAEVRAKEEELAQLKAMPEYAARRLALDLWTAAFFWPLTDGAAWAPTTAAYRNWIEHEVPPPEEANAKIERIARANHFFHWSLEFPEVFSAHAGGGGFDVVLGNPPWVSYSGRQRSAIDDLTLRFLLARYPAISTWPASHPAFLVLATQLISKHGRAGLVLPRQVADLDSYGATRAQVTSTARIIEPILNAGENAFPGVTQPVGLFTLAAGTNGKPSSSAAWVTHPMITEAVPSVHGTGSDFSGSTALMGVADRLAQLPRFEPTTFADPGVHTGNVSKKIVLNERLPEGREYALVREGRDIGPYVCARPRKWLWLDPTLNEGEYCTIRAIQKYTDVPILIRQTADRPIAARHVCPTYFRNSLLACRGVEGIPDAVVTAFLNSALYTWIHRTATQDAHQKAFPQVKVRHLRALPAIPSAALERSYQGGRLQDAIEAAVVKAEGQASQVAVLPREIVESIERLVLLAFDLPPDLAPILLECTT